MMNTVEFIPRANYNIDDYILRAEELRLQEIENRYIDELTLAYEKLREMYEYNYDTIIDSDYDEMISLHYYEWI
tara:strand:- start:1443 stop:1664 length:222 start_codon:yes stop_codon:yes gene_type:complete